METREGIRVKINKQSHESYVQQQISTNKEKIGNVWAREDEMLLVSERAKKIEGPLLGICHGARNGWEVKRLRELLSGRDFVIGTDIAPTAREYGLLQWDFHDPIPWLLGRASFIYTNSLDHSYDPEMVLGAWKKHLAPSGRIFIEWSPSHGEGSTDMCDVFGASLLEYQELITKNFGPTIIHPLAERVIFEAGI